MHLYRRAGCPHPAVDNDERTFQSEGAVYNNALTNCATRVSPRGPSLALRAIHLVSRLRRLNRLCSSTVSDTANRYKKRTDPKLVSVAEEKSSAVPLFRSGRRSLIFAGLRNKGNWSPKRIETLVSILLEPQLRVSTYS